jgi:iron complex transport system substrate-binding protein
LPRLSSLFFIAGIIASFAVHADCVVKDDTGQTIQLNQPAKRVIVLAPDLVENVFAIGAGDKITGVVQGSDYPAAARQLPIVGSYSGIDLERIVLTKPDLIIAWKYAFLRQLQAFKRMGIPVYIAEPKQLNDVPKLMRQLGCLLDKKKEADLAASRFEADLIKLQQMPHPAKPPKVFFQIDAYALITINKNSWINQVITLCGGKNLYADAKTIAPEISRESLMADNPEIIFNVSANDNWKASWQKWGSISAVKNHQLHTIAPDLISRAGPRLVKGAYAVCQQLNPVMWDL